MQYETFKAWALRQNWLEIQKNLFVVPNGTIINTVTDEDTLIRQIRQYAMIMLEMLR